MRTPFIRTLLLITAIPLSLLLGCSSAPKVERVQSGIGACDNLSIIQRGNEIAPVDGIFRIDRAPFVARYNGSAKEPALAVSVNGEVAKALQLRGRKYVWGSGGDYMAYAPSDLPLLTEYRLYTDEKSRDEFASMIGGEDYVKLLRSLVQSDPSLDTATLIPKAAGDFKLDPATNSYRYDIKKLHGYRVADLPARELYVTYFATVERYGPPKQGRYQYQNLVKLSWGSCVIKFNS